MGSGQIDAAAWQRRACFSTHDTSAHSPAGSPLWQPLEKNSMQQLRGVPSFAYALQHTDGIIPNTKIAKKLGEILPTMDSEPR